MRLRGLRHLHYWLKVWRASVFLVPEDDIQALDWYHGIHLLDANDWWCILQQRFLERWLPTKCDSQGQRLRQTSIQQLLLPEEGRQHGVGILGMHSEETLPRKNFLALEHPSALYAHEVVEVLAELHHILLPVNLHRRAPIGQPRRIIVDCRRQQLHLLCDRLVQSRVEVGIVVVKPCCVCVVGDDRKLPVSRQCSWIQDALLQVLIPFQRLDESGTALRVLVSCVELFGFGGQALQTPLAACSENPLKFLEVRKWLRHKWSRWPRGLPIPMKASAIRFRTWRWQGSPFAIRDHGRDCGRCNAVSILSIGDEVGSGSHKSFQLQCVSALVPFADLLNHANDAPTWWGPSTLGGFELKAIQPIPAGSAVTCRYGVNRSNVEMILQYGFMPGNVAHSVELTFSIEADPLYSLKREVLLTMDLYRSFRFGLDRGFAASGPPLRAPEAGWNSLTHSQQEELMLGEVLTFLRVSTLEPADIEEDADATGAFVDVDEAFIERLRARNCVLSAELEGRVASRLEAICQEHMAKVANGVLGADGLLQALRAKASSLLDNAVDGIGLPGVASTAAEYIANEREPYALLSCVARTVREMVQSNVWPTDAARAAENSGCGLASRTAELWARSFAAAGRHSQEL